MQKKKATILIAIASLLLLDLAYSFLQHYHAPLDGDMPGLIVPNEHYQTVLQHPFGLKAIQQDTSYAGVNRSFIHRAIYHYFRIVPAALQSVTDPTNSVYGAAALFKLGVHTFLLWLLAAYAHGRLRIWKWQWLLPALLIAPLFQSGGLYYNLMGVVGRSPTYGFFYAFPVAVLAAFYFPAYAVLFCKKGLSQKYLIRIMSLLMAVLLPFSGPLIPGIVLVASFVVLLQLAFTHLRKGKLPDWTTGWKRLPFLYWFSVLLLNLLCLYSLYLGQYNAEHSQSVSVLERYATLPTGLFYQFTNKPGPALLIVMLAGNTLLLRYKVRTEESRRALHALRWVVLFTFVYILLLPLGGYREYRPLIIRKDSILPVLLMLFYIWGLGGQLLLRKLKGRWKSGYLIAIVPLLFLFLLADKPEFDANQCEKAALKGIEQSPSGKTPLPDDCLVLSWDAGHQARQSELIMELLRIWNIAD